MRSMLRTAEYGIRRGAGFVRGEKWLFLKVIHENNEFGHKPRVIGMVVLEIGADGIVRQLDNIRTVTSSKPESIIRTGYNLSHPGSDFVSSRSRTIW